MLSQKYPSFDTDFKQYLMSLVGTVIYQPGTSDSKAQPSSFWAKAIQRSSPRCSMAATAPAFMPATPPTSASTRRQDLWPRNGLRIMEGLGLVVTT
jgi:hypothetical protein